MNIFFALKGSNLFYSYFENIGKICDAPISIAMVWQFHDGMQVRVQNDGEYSELFSVTKRAKQGCVMAPTLFSMMFSAMLIALQTYWL